MATANRLIGVTIDKAHQHDLFRWFHLAPAGRDSANGQTRLDFRPSGKSFHQLVLVSAWLGADQRIQRLRLTLARGFVDDPRQGMFARDIAKSFLQATAPSTGSPELRDLISQIEFDRTGVSVPIISRADRELPSPPQLSTPGYLVYLGQQPRHEISQTGGGVQMENSDEPPERQLHITVT